MQKEFGYKNPMQVPRLDKIVINMGVGEAAGDQKKLDAAVADLTLIAGQRPVKTIAKKAIAGFKIREGLPIGTKVTLRRARMYGILGPAGHHRTPRVRDFRGMSGKGFDGRGNFAMGLKEQILFPEIAYDKVDAVRGMDIVIVTTAKTDAEAKALLKAFDLPFVAAPHTGQGRGLVRDVTRLENPRPRPAGSGGLFTDGQDFRRQPQHQPRSNGQA